MQSSKTIEKKKEKNNWINPVGGWKEKEDKQKKLYKEKKQNCSKHPIISESTITE